MIAAMDGKALLALELDRSDGRRLRLGSVSRGLLLLVFVRHFG